MRSCPGNCASTLNESWRRDAATGEGENHIERANDYEWEADKELTWSVRRAIRRDAVFGFITPFVTALPRADVAWRRDTFASSTFFSASTYAIPSPSKL